MDSVTATSYLVQNAINYLSKLQNFYEGPVFKFKQF